MSKILVAVISTFVLFTLPIQGLAAENQLDWDTLTANSIYSNYINSAVDDIESTSYTITGLTEVYKNEKAKKPDSYLFLRNTGMYEKNALAQKFYDNSAEVIQETKNENDVQSVRMKIITKDDKIFINFPDSQDEQIKKNWFVMDHKTYLKLGNILELSTLFDFAVQEFTKDQQKVYKKTGDLAKKYDLYWRISNPIKDGLKVPKSTRYNLGYNYDGMKEYYDNLDVELTKEEMIELYGKDLGIIDTMKDEDNLLFYTDRSYFSIWMDTKTNLPRKQYNFITLPLEKGKRFYSQVSVDLKDVNKDVTIMLPKNVLSDLTILEESLNKEVQEQEEDPLQNIEALKIKLKNKPRNADKALIYYKIGDEYYSMGDLKSAAANYKSAIALFKAKTVDLSLAKIEYARSTGDTASMKKEYEAALKLWPKDDYLLNEYGWFLLGLSVSSKDSQNLTEALTVNKKLVVLLVDDMNLLNLFATYELLGDKVNAQKTKARFDNFESRENLNVLVRIYHRLGKEELKQKYLAEMKKVGEDLTYWDKEYLKLSF